MARTSSLGAKKSARNRNHQVNKSKLESVYCKTKTRSTSRDSLKNKLPAEIITFNKIAAIMTPLTKIHKTHPLLSRFSLEAVTAMFESSRIITLKPEEILYQQGDLELRVYLIIYGSFILLRDPNHETLPSSKNRQRSSTMRQADQTNDTALELSNEMDPSKKLVTEVAELVIHETFNETTNESGPVALDSLTDNGPTELLGKYTLGQFIGEEWIYHKRYTKREESCEAVEDSCVLELTVESYELIREVLLGLGLAKDVSMMES